MTLLYYDPVFMEHQTGDHPERPSRLLPIVNHLSFVGLDAMCDRPSWQSATVKDVNRVHKREYLDSLQHRASQGGGWLDEDTVISSQSFDVALRASGAVCDAAERVMGGESHNAFCMTRPPGHHALADRAMGFCLINHVAVAARLATQSLGCKRVMIVDFDVHHGNGTQDLFEDDPSVSYFSIHRSPFYPHTGLESETGRGDGIGTNCNLPVGIEVDRETQFRMFEDKLGEFADAMQPDLLFLSAGFDAHRDDPIGSLGWQTDDYIRVTEMLMRTARKHCRQRIVSVLEGGYNAKALSDSITVHLETLLDE